MSLVFSQPYNTYTFSTTCIAKKNTLNNTGEVGWVEAKFISKQLLSMGVVMLPDIVVAVVVMQVATVAVVPVPAVPSINVCVRAFWLNQPM